ncbi:MAG: hypothetical protein KDK39_07410 [Leptospiraceae bacterium]|nr:hypothetical protein [Leptospiraceae bacterium]
MLAIQVFLKHRFPINNAVWGDWYALPFFGALFLFGYMLIMVKDVIWDAFRAIKWPALVAGIVLFPLMYWQRHQPGQIALTAILEVFNLWSWILAVFGFSSQYLNKPGRIIAYRNQAVYPFYILHQTITVIIGYYLMDLQMSIMIKFVLLTGGTFLGSWLIYETLIRRIAILRPLFGLKKGQT